MNTAFQNNMQYSISISVRRCFSDSASSIVSCLPVVSGALLVCKVLAGRCGVACLPVGETSVSGNPWTSMPLLKQIMKTDVTKPSGDCAENARKQWRKAQRERERCCAWGQTQMHCMLVCLCQGNLISSILLIASNACLLNVQGSVAYMKYEHLISPSFI